MYIFEALGGYVRMLDKSDSKIFDLCWSSLDTWILKSKYPYFFDTQVKKPCLDGSTSKQNFFTHNLKNSDEETDKMDDYSLETNLNEEENNFVKTRRAIIYLILKFWSKIEDLNLIFIMNIRQRQANYTIPKWIAWQEINYQIEALLNVFLSYLKGRCISIIDWFMPILDKKEEFFFSDKMKNIFVWHKSHQLLSNKYFGWVVQLKSAIIDENFWRKLWTNAQNVSLDKIFF